MTEDRGIQKFDSEGNPVGEPITLADLNRRAYETRPLSLPANVVVDLRDYLWSERRAGRTPVPDRLLAALEHALK